MCQVFAGQDPNSYKYQTRSMRLNGQSTSIRLEATFWGLLEHIARSQGLSVPKFVSTLHEEVLLLHGEVQNFTSLLRCSCIVHLQAGRAEYGVGNGAETDGSNAEAQIPAQMPVS